MFIEANRNNGMVTTSDRILNKISQLCQQLWWISNLHAPKNAQANQSTAFCIRILAKRATSAQPRSRFKGDTAACQQNTWATSLCQQTAGFGSLIRQNPAEYVKPHEQYRIDSTLSLT